jgi:hypothetical protein
MQMWHSDAASARFTEDCTITQQTPNEQSLERLESLLQTGNSPIIKQTVLPVLSAASTKNKLITLAALLYLQPVHDQGMT